ncbi:unnamed protein product, partial [Polarella glacialis]
SATLCAMDVSEVAQVWWTDVSTFKKENLRLEDARVKRLVQRLLLQNDEAYVGLVAHSILFKRLLQIFWPSDPATQGEVRAALRNGAPEDTMDPLNDKVMNCGTLVLTFRYKRGGAEIIGAEFLFNGHMESALSSDQKESIEEECDVDEAPEEFEKTVRGMSTELELL